MIHRGPFPPLPFCDSVKMRSEFAKINVCLVLIRKFCFVLSLQWQEKMQRSPDLFLLCVFSSFFPNECSTHCLCGWDLKLLFFPCLWLHCVILG